MLPNAERLAPAAGHQHSAHRFWFGAPRLLCPRLPWVICVGLSFVASATFSALEFASPGWNRLCDPAIGPDQLQRAVVTFGICFAGTLLSSSAVAFSSLGLLRRTVRRWPRPERVRRSTVREDALTSSVY